MKKKLIVLVSVLVGVGILASVLSNAGWEDIWLTLQQMTWGKFFAFLALTQVSYGLFNLRWQIILKTHGYKVPFWTLWLYRASGYGVSYITPTQVGGEPVRIYFLNENHDISLKEATASVLFDKLMEISAFVAFVAMGVVAVAFTNILPPSTLYPILGLLALFAGLCAYIFKKLIDGTGFLTTMFKKLGLHKFRRIRRFENKIHQTEQLITEFLSHTEHKKTTLPLIAGLSLGAWVATICEYYVLAQFLGFSLTAFEAFLVGTVPAMAYLLPVPGGLGMLEGAQAGMFTLLGYTTSMALAVVVMVRVKEIFFSAIGFAYALTHGVTLMGKEKHIKGSLDKPRALRPAARAHQPRRDTDSVTSDQSAVSTSPETFERSP